MNKIEKGIESNMVYLQIKELMENARKQVSVKINNILVQTYWKIGKIIIEDEQENSERAEYGKKLLKELSKKLTKVNGRLEATKSRGFSLFAKGLGNKNEDGTVETLKIELKQLIKSKQSIYSMFDKMKNSDGRRKEFRLNFGFENVAITEELGQYVPLDMISAKSGILNGVLKLENDKAKKTMNALGNLKIRNGKLKYVDLDGDIEGVNALIDLKKDKFTSDKRIRFTAVLAECTKLYQ